jgi:oligosaccharide repeat unit polymerase
MPSLVSSMVLLTLALASVWVSSRLFGHPISPFSVFYGVWFFTLALYFLRWLAYTPVRAQAWSLIVLNLGSFGFGWILAYLSQRLGTLHSYSQLATQNISAERLRKVICLSFALGMVGLIDFLRRVQGLLGLITFIVAPHEIRQAMALGGGLDEGIKPFNWLNVMTIVLCAFYLGVFRGERRRLVWIILFTSIVATLFMEDRTRFFYALLWAGYVLAHVRRWNTRKLLATGLVLAVVLALQFFIVAAWLGKVALNNPVLLQAATVDEDFAPLLTPYSYLTGSYPALQAYLETRPESTAGAMTFYPAYKVLRLVDPSLKAPQIVAEPVAIPSEVNTFTWLHQFYTDFGVAGVILGPLGVAFLSGLVYFNMLRTKSFYSLYANGLISFGLTLSFMVNHLTQGPAWYFLAVGIPIAHYVRHRSSAKADTFGRFALVPGHPLDAPS